MRVLVTDAYSRAALAVVRSLGRAGHVVVAYGLSRHDLALHSRWARAAVSGRDPLLEPAAFVDSVAATCREHNIDMIVPVTEASHLALLPEVARFNGVRFPCADAATFRAVSDKARVMEAARHLGIAVPAQHTIEAPGEAAQLRDRLRFPVVLKPGRSVAAGVALTVRYARNVAEFDACVSVLPDAAFPLLIQQRVVGPGAGVFLLVWDGRVLATFSHQRLREMPPSGGGSVCSQSVTADPMLVDRSRVLLDSFGWRGVAMVEYKRDAATGTPYLMEINGRFWGSLQLAIDAGVDFPALLVAAAAGQPVPPPPSYRVGVRLRQFWGDVDHLITRLRHSPDALALPPGAPSSTRVLLDFFTPRRHERLETFRWSDPGPFMADTRNWFRARFDRGTKA